MIKLDEVSEEDVRCTFYNALMDTALNDRSISIDNLKNVTTVKSLIAKVIYNICLSPEELTTVKGVAITSNNVPGKYLKLLIALRQLRQLITNRDHLRVQHLVEGIVDDIERQGTFAPIIERFIIFYQECHRNQATTQIDAQLIKSTFYNLMVEQVLLESFISKEDLVSMEPYIFLALSALVIIASVDNSKDCPGMLLQNGGIVKEHNCPEEYLELLGTLNQLKVVFNKMKPNEDQIRLIKMCSMQKQDLVLPQDLEIYHTAPLMQLVSMVTKISIKISQMSSFKDIISNVIAFCITAWGDTSRSGNPT